MNGPTKKKRRPALDAAPGSQNYGCVLRKATGHDRNKDKIKKTLDTGRLVRDVSAARFHKKREARAGRSALRKALFAARGAFPCF